MLHFDEADRILRSHPVKPLGFFPTPLHRLDRLSADLGVNLYLKRDDMTGMSLFGGNKIRKLEYLISDAIAQGCDTVFTFGATQSNHAMQTATACRRYGLTPILYLVAIVEPSADDLRGNLLLDRLLGAQIHIVPMGEGNEMDAVERSVALAQEHRLRLEQEGHACYMVPMGGASPVGSAGFVSGYVELMRQLQTINVHADYLFHSTGTGGTHAGLIAGRKLLDADTGIIGISASTKPPEHSEKIARLSTDALRYLGSDKTVTPQEASFDHAYVGPGYEIPSEESGSAIKYLARNEGILLDPVYTGKAFAGMLAYIREGKIPPGSNVVFWHTGGATALFAEKDVVGNLFE